MYEVLTELDHVIPAIPLLKSLHSSTNVNFIHNNNSCSSKPEGSQAICYLMLYTLGLRACSYNVRIVHFPSSPYINAGLSYKYHQVMLTCHATDLS